MSQSSAPTGPPAPSKCWNCQEPLSAGSIRCLFCGMAQKTAPVAEPVAAAVAAPAGAASPAASPAAAPAAAAAPSPVVKQRAVPVRVSGAVDAGPGFAGTIAGTGARIVAFTVDVIAVVGVSVAVGLLTGHVVYAAIALVEMIVGLWVLEARTGATIGNALLRIRSSREDAPYSPGIGRAFVRSLLTGIGFLVLGIGAWVVVASASFDSTRRGRSWADKAARTLVVSVPRRERAVAAPAPAAGPLPAGVVPIGGVAPSAAPGVQSPPGVQIIPAQEAPIVLAAPQVISTLVRPAAVDENSASSSHTGAAAQVFAAQPVPVVESPATPMARGTDAAPGGEPGTGTLLLIFDTGQREQLATPVAVNLGRNPVVTEPTDKLITVADPESTVSKTHLRLEHSRGSTWVTDGGSTNGTELLSDEGEVTKLAPGARVLVDEGVRVRVGNRAFTISILLGDNS